MHAALARSTTTLHLSSWRPAAALMLAGAAVQPLLPGPGGLPCLLREATGIPCPLCGMTTSVTAAVHLDLGRAWAATPAGLFAVAAAVILLAVRRPASLEVPRWVPFALPAAMWLFQLQRFHVL